MKNFLNKRVQGEYFENLALNFLEKEGFSLLEKNFYCKYGEIDIILRKSDLIVFVEVKQRSSKNFGTGFDAISYTKQKKMYLTAQNFLYRNSLENFNFRFDAVVFDEKGSCHWIKNIMWGDEIGF